MEQNFKNHSRFVTGYHKVLSGLLFVGLVGAIINLINSVGSDNLYSASLLVLLFVCFGLLGYYTRAFPLKAQDRAIRSEENFRHYILTGKQLPAALKMSQIVSLRFSSDEEFPALVIRSLNENLSAKDIKGTIKYWKADNNRV